MKTAKSKLPLKLIKLGSKEKYTRLFSVKNGDAITFHSGCVVLKEDESVGEHNTDGAEEMLIILEGEGELYANGFEKLDFEKGTALYIPPNTVHDVRNTGTSLLKYVFITCPAVKA